MLSPLREASFGPPMPPCHMMSPHVTQLVITCQSPHALWSLPGGGDFFEGTVGVCPLPGHPGPGGGQARGAGAKAKGQPPLGPVPAARGEDALPDA